MYFFTTENVADVKLETDIVEKRLAIHFLLLRTCYDRERHVL